MLAMWLWVVWISTVAVAVAVQRFVAPRLTAFVEEGDERPDFSRLGTARHATVAGALAAAAGSVYLATPPEAWPAWFGYVALGAPLVYVDAHTTYLPNRLMYPMWVLVGAGVSLRAVADPWAGLASFVGAVAAYGVFWLVWRFSSSFGFGDVRLAAVIGAVAGPGGAVGWVWAFLVGTALGAVAAIAFTVRGRRLLPYGPWLWLGPLVAVWWPVSGS